MGTDNGAPARSTTKHLVIQVILPRLRASTFHLQIQSPPEQLFLPTQVPALQPTPGILVMAVLFKCKPVHFIHTLAGGTYNCVLTVTNAGGCSETITQQIVVTQCGTASLTTTNVCQGTAATITITGSICSANAFTWNSPMEEQLYQEAEQGRIQWFEYTRTFNVNVLSPKQLQYCYCDAADNNLCNTECIHQRNSCIGVPVRTIQLISVEPQVPVQTYAWNFAGGNVGSGSGSGPLIRSNGLQPVIHNLQVIVTDNGCRDTAVFAVVVNPIPTSTFNATHRFAGSPVTVNYTGTGSAARITTWGFDGGTVVSKWSGPYISLEHRGEPSTLRWLLLKKWLHIYSVGGCSCN